MIVLLAAKEFYHKTIKSMETKVTKAKVSIANKFTDSIKSIIAKLISKEVVDISSKEFMDNVQKVVNKNLENKKGRMLL